MVEKKHYKKSDFVLVKSLASEPASLDIRQMVNCLNAFSFIVKKKS